MKKMCIDLGGTNMRIALMDGGKVYQKIVFPTNATNPKENIDQIIKFYNEYKLNDKIIYLCCPGPLNDDNSMMTNTPNLPDWNYYPFKKEISESLNVDVKIINDANAATLGESLIFNQYNTVLYFTISTGFGAGLSINKQIFNGENNTAFEIKDVIVPKPNSLKYGDLNGLEDFTSGTGIYKLAIANGLNVNSTKEVFELYENGNAIAYNILEYVKNTIADFLSNCCYLINPGIIVLGGSVILNNEEFFNDIKKRIYKNNNPLIEKTKIQMASSSGDSGLIGLTLI